VHLLKILAAISSLEKSWMDFFSARRVVTLNVTVGRFSLAIIFADFIRCADSGSSARSTNPGGLDHRGGSEVKGRVWFISRFPRCRPGHYGCL